MTSHCLLQLEETHQMRQMLLTMAQAPQERVNTSENVKIIVSHALMSSAAGLLGCKAVGLRCCGAVGLWDFGAVGLWGWGCGAVGASGLWGCGAVGLCLHCLGIPTSPPVSMGVQVQVQVWVWVYEAERTKTEIDRSNSAASNLWKTLSELRLVLTNRSDGALILGQAPHKTPGLGWGWGREGYGSTPAVQLLPKAVENTHLPARCTNQEPA
eukprot:CAMPEP_0174384084 /NCGR_PEP_ID=MMETSP0811_2-20130205/125675_1 /TAXON_ID=73025 ORGANISM="Eutreptiella gymnastica-like, Strain CCMP1594" /NCGR_SAMPLE_ID=MMETSP0811_2 /ASSEMBLY_ACC=CAM_ASM_000667 /LENGTH=211 /DNA_ID=CAMNT_0015537909 /DNA_START=230 /DNA_END=868 /DNA_ORIENTATION=-